MSELKEQQTNATCHTFIGEVTFSKQNILALPKNAIAPESSTINAELEICIKNTCAYKLGHLFQKRTGNRNKSGLSSEQGNFVKKEALF